MPTIVPIDTTATYIAVPHPVTVSAIGASVFVGGADVDNGDTEIAVETPTAATEGFWAISDAGAKLLVSETKITFGDLDPTLYDTDGTLTADSDTVLATQKAVKAYADNL